MRYAAAHPTLTWHGQYAVPQHRYSLHALHYAATHNTLTWHGQYAVPQHRYSQHVLHDAATPQQHHSEITQADHRCYLPGLPLFFTATSNNNDNNNNAFQLMTS